MANANQQAKELYDMVLAARKVFSVDRRYSESEVQFRFDAINGILIMAENDVLAMLKAWQKEDEP